MLVVAAFMTSFYSWRLMFMTFYGKPRGDKHTHDHAHESPNVMLIPLLVLAFGAVFSGMMFYKSFFASDESVGKFFGAIETTHDDHASVGFSLVAPAYAATQDVKEDGDHAAAEWPAVPGKGAIFKAADNHVLHDAHYVPIWVKLSPFIAMLSGLALAWLFYIKNPSLPVRLAKQQAPLYNFLLNKWYFDEIYDVILVKPALWIGRFLWKQGDTKIIDGSLNGVAMGIIPFFTRLSNKAQSGYIFTYAFAMVLGIAAMITWVTMFGGAN
jgi:NADH-quinone oxidoreductase subunit L